MRSHRSDRPRRRSWLFAVFASLALAAQFVVAIAPLAEGRQGRSMSAHVESAGGTKGHYTHDDATCAACQARSIHSPTVKTDVALVFNPPAISPIAAPIARSIAGDPSPQTNPRAPPSVI